MTKITLNLVSIAFLFALLTVQHSLCADPPQFSPAPSPELGADDIPPPTADFNYPSPLGSPPSPPAADLAPETSPSPSPARSRKSLSPSPSPAPAPMVEADMRHESTADAVDLDSEESSDGLKGGQKAGIAVGVIAGVCVVGLGALVYKKRQQNIRRAQFGYAGNIEML